MAPAERSSKRRRVEDIAEAFMEGDSITISSARQSDPLANLHLHKDTKTVLAEVSKPLQDGAHDESTEIWRDTTDDASSRRRSRRGFQSFNGGGDDQPASSSPHLSKSGEWPYDDDPTMSERGSHAEPKRTRNQRIASQRSNGPSRPVTSIPSIVDPGSNTKRGQRRLAATSRRPALPKSSRRRPSAASQAGRKKSTSANGKVSSKRKSTIGSDLSEAFGLDESARNPQSITLPGKQSIELPEPSAHHGADDDIAAQTARFRSSAGYGAQFASTYIADGDESEHEELVESQPEVTTSAGQRQGTKSKPKTKTRRQATRERVKKSQSNDSAAAHSDTVIPSRSSEENPHVNDVSWSDKTHRNPTSLWVEGKAHDGMDHTDPGKMQSHSPQDPVPLPRLSTSDAFLAQALKMPQTPSWPWRGINQGSHSIPVGLPQVATVQPPLSKLAPEDEKRYTPPPMNEEQASMMGSFSIFEKGFSPSEAALSMLGRSKKLNKAKQTGAPSISNPGRPEGWVPCHPGRGPMSQDDPRRAIDPKLPKDQQKRMTAFRIELTKPKPLYTEVNSPSNSESPFLMRKRGSTTATEERGITPTLDGHSRSDDADAVKPDAMPSGAGSEAAGPSTKVEDAMSGGQQPSVPAQQTALRRQSPSNSPGVTNVAKTRSPAPPSSSTSPTMPASSAAMASTALQPPISLSSLFASLVKPTSTEPPDINPPGFRQTDMVYQPSPATIFDPASVESQGGLNGSFVGRIVKDAQGNNVQETPIPVPQPFREFELSFNDSSGQKVNITLNDQLVNTILKDRGPGESAHAMKERLRRELLLSGAVITDTTSQAEAAQFYDVGDVAIQRYKSLMSKTTSTVDDDKHGREKSQRTEDADRQGASHDSLEVPPEASKVQEPNHPTETKTSNSGQRSKPAEFRPGASSDSVHGFRPINVQSWPDTQTMLRQAEHDLVSSPQRDVDPSDAGLSRQSRSSNLSFGQSVAEPDGESRSKGMSTQQMEEAWEPWSTIKKPRAQSLARKQSTHNKRRSNLSQSDPHESEPDLKYDASATPSAKGKGTKRGGKGRRTSKEHSAIDPQKPIDAKNRSITMDVQNTQGQKMRNDESDDEDTIMVASNTS